MTRTQILNIRLDELEKENNKLKVRVRNLYIRRYNELTNVLREWFVPFNVEDRDVSFKFTDHKVEVIAKKVNKDDVSFSFTLSEEWEDGKTTYTGFRLNQLNVGVGVSEELIKVFYLTAQWSQFVLDYQDDIIAELNMVQERYEKYIEILRGKENELRKSINQQESDIAKLTNKELIA
tara:strand:+ start:282 stop:815 length:534 start_codon:yes stop_codon:yes gene_type:complete